MQVALRKLKSGGVRLSHKSLKNKESHFTILRNPITIAINHKTQLDEALKGSTDYIINYIAESLPESDVIPNLNPFEDFLLVISLFLLILIFNPFKIDLSH